MSDSLQPNCSKNREENKANIYEGKMLEQKIRGGEKITPCWQFVQTV